LSLELLDFCFGGCDVEDVDEADFFSGEREAVLLAGCGSKVEEDGGGASSGSDCCFFLVVLNGLMFGSGIEKEAEDGRRYWRELPYLFFLPS
jgi:hypothetical protein